MRRSNSHFEPGASQERLARLFLKLSMFLPIVVPIATYLAVASGAVTLKGYGGLLVVVMFSLLIGGIPYLIFLVGFFVWMRGKTADQIRMATWLAPVICTGVFAACAFIVILLQALSSAGTRVDGDIAGYAVFVIAFGYGYVLIVNVGYFLFRRLLVLVDRFSDGVGSTKLD